MLFFDGGFGLLLLALWLFCIIDVITTDSACCRHLPKTAWLVLVLVLPDVGSIAWLVAGRVWNAGGRDLPYKGNRGYPEYDRPGRYTPARPEDDEAFLRQLRERAEQQRREHRRRAEAQQRADENRRRAERQRWEQEGQDPLQD